MTDKPASSDIITKMLPLHERALWWQINDSPAPAGKSLLRPALAILMRIDAYLIQAFQIGAACFVMQFVYKAGFHDGQVGELYSFGNFNTSTLWVLAPAILAFACAFVGASFIRHKHDPLPEGLHPFGQIIISDKHVRCFDNGRHRSVPLDAITSVTQDYFEGSPVVIFNVKNAPPLYIYSTDYIAIRSALGQVAFDGLLA